MSLPKMGQISWLVRKEDKTNGVIGFLIDKDNFGALIVGGATGSHLTGHGEAWRSKWDALLSEGYCPENEAKEKGILPANWTPPKVSQEDKKLISIVSTVNRKIVKD